MPKHVFTLAECRRGGARSGGHFRRGRDPRRHVLTSEECRRGGKRSWARFMVSWRVGQGLPVPAHLAGLLAEVLAGEPA